LRDTILDYDLAQGNSTGFLFEQATAEDLADCVRRALRVFANQPSWRAMQQCGMRQDFSWERSAEKYLHLYQQLVSTQAALQS
jgi:starch synthase